MDYFPGFCHKAYDYDARCLTYHLHKYPHIFQHISGKLSVEVIFMDNKKNDTEMSAALAKNTLDEIPKAKSDAREIVGLVKHSGKIDGYQLSDGSTVSKDEGVQMAKNGEIKGVGVAHRRDTEYLKSIPDDSENNNLGSLPTVSG